MEVLFLVMFVVMIVVGGAMASIQREERHNRAQDVARDLGLSVKGTDELTGVFNGVSVTQYSKDLGSSSNTDWWTFTRCRLNEELPGGMAVANQGFMGHLADMFGAKDIQLGNELDPELRINGDREEDVRELMCDPDVLKNLRSVVHNGGKLTLRGRDLEIRVRGRHLENAEPRVRMATELVLALARARRKHWSAVAAVHGLEPEGHNRMKNGVLDVTWREGVTEIRGRVRRFLPTGTRVMHVDKGVGKVKLGDPILDTMVSIETSDPAALSERLSDDEVRGALLEVVHGFPGSMVTEREIILATRQWPGRFLEKGVDAVKELQRGLD